MIPHVQDVDRHRFGLPFSAMEVHKMTHTDKKGTKTYHELERIEFGFASWPITSSSATTSGIWTNALFFAFHFDVVSPGIKNIIVNTGIKSK
jgi:hypothetical protein